MQEGCVGQLATVCCPEMQLVLGHDPGRALSGTQLTQVSMQERVNTSPPINTCCSSVLSFVIVFFFKDSLGLRFFFFIR